MRVACLRKSLHRRSSLRPHGSSSIVFRSASLLFVIALVPVAPLMTGCGGASLAVNLNTIAAIGTPASSVRVNQTLQLTSSYLASGLPMTFYVNGIAGGNAQVGTISSTGVYTAPAVVPTPYTVTITSSIAKYPTAVPGSVSVQVWNPIPVLSAATPNGFSEGTTTVTVSGSQFVYGAQISWNGALVPTTYVSSTQLVAQIAAPNPGTFPLTVTNPDPGSASAIPLSMKVGPGLVVLTLEPNSGTDVRVSNSLNLGLMVNGTDNPAVTLQVNGIAGGNGVVGTAISNTNGSITYTAPAVVPTPSNIVQLTITSVDNPAVSITQNISVMNPIPILTSATPMAFDPGPATIVLTGQKFITGAQVLVNGSPVSTTFNSGTQVHRELSIKRNPAISISRCSTPTPARPHRPISSLRSAAPPPTPVVTPRMPRASLSRPPSAPPTPTSIRSHSIGYSGLAQPAVRLAAHAHRARCRAGRHRQQSALRRRRRQMQRRALCPEQPERRSGAGHLLAAIAHRARSAAPARQVRALAACSSSPATTRLPFKTCRAAKPTTTTCSAPTPSATSASCLQDVTLNPMMGQFLSMQGNDKGNATTDPDENYAREVMQLFTIGL